MRVLMLTQWFQPESFFKGLPFAVELQRRGHEVEVLTGFPNYPGGKVHEGYSIKPWQREELEGVRINRVALYPNHSNSGLLRIVNYLSFSLMTLLVGPWLLHKKPDVIYIYNLVTLSRTAALLRRLYGCKIVYDIQDLWPESVISSGMLSHSGLFRTFLEKWCLSAYKRADFLIVQSPGFKDNLCKRGIAEEKTKVIYNWSQEETVRSTREECTDAKIMRLEWEKTFNVVFAGTMGIMQNLETVLDCAQLMQEERQVRLVLIGDGIRKEYLQNKSNKMGLQNVAFMPRQPMNSMEKVYTCADALLVHLKKDPLFKVTIPSKIQAYLAAGKPIVMAVEGDAADVIRRAGAGYTCEPENAQEMADCIRKLVKLSPEERNRLGENGKKFYIDEMSFSRGVHEFEGIFKSVLNGTPKNKRLSG